VSAPPPSPSHPHAVSLSLEYDDERVARLVTDAVAVEVGEIDDDRSTVTVERAGRTLHVEVLARDLVALRAGVNSWLRIVETAEAVCESVG
jgi:KEOPS complex subunit Pcc1